MEGAALLTEALCETAHRYGGGKGMLRAAARPLVEAFLVAQSLGAAVHLRAPT